MKDITSQLEHCPEIIRHDAETSPSLDSSVKWRGAHGVRYTEDFRKVVYKINPNHLSCGYKELFEASATSCLRGMEPDDGDEHKALTKKTKDENNTWATPVRPHTQGSCISLHSAKYKFDSPPPHRGQSQIIQSLSAAHASGPQKIVVKKEFRGWDVCSRPHSADSSGYLQYTSAETRDMMRNRSQSACVKYGEKVSMSKVQISGPSRSQSTSGRFQGDATDRTDETPSHHTSSIGSSNHNIPIPCPYIPSYTNSADAICYEFEHFMHPKNHTKKYREDYTYRRLEMIKNPRSCSSVLRMHVPCSCIPITAPVFKCSKAESSKCNTPVDISPTRSPNPRRTPTNEQPSGVIRMAANCKKAVLKKRLTKPPVTEMGRKVPHFFLAQNGTLKIEFYNNPMTFDKPEDQKTLHKPPSPIVCRTRPTIPSNAHGNIYPSSTDTHSYVIKRRKGIQ